MEIFQMFLSNIWNHLVSFSGTIVIIGLIAGFVIFLAERFVYCRKKRKSGK